jgi:hypothetical protein
MNKSLNRVAIGVVKSNRRSFDSLPQFLHCVKELRPVAQDDNFAVTRASAAKR